MQRALHLTTYAILALVTLLGAPVLAEGPMVRYEVESDFESAKDNVKFAITNQGLVITAESHINEMLERTGDDLGLGGPVYTDAVAFEFCSARFSRLMMAADPHNIVFCPFVISVYQVPANPETVYVAYLRPENAEGSEEAQQALAEVAEFLDGIAREATAW